MFSEPNSRAMHRFHCGHFWAVAEHTAAEREIICPVSETEIDPVSAWKSMTDPRKQMTARCRVQSKRPCRKFGSQSWCSKLLDNGLDEIHQTYWACTAKDKCFPFDAYNRSAQGETFDDIRYICNMMVVVPVTY
jgi:hypothetical protein